MKKLEEYKLFIYFYEGMPTEEDVVNQAINQHQVSMTTESHPINVELQNEVDAHLNFEISVCERDVELPNIDVHSDSKVERQNEETRVESRLSKYFKRHHLSTQIIGDKDARPMTRIFLRSESCLLSVNEPKIVKNTL